MFDVLQKNLNVEQYAFVEASAGTGKTFAIEHLAVRLILAGIPISRLLVMTFTKAARTELIRRIHQRLQGCLETCESGQTEIPYLASIARNDAIRLLRAALQSFHEARITTIHGFCQSLLSKYAFEAGLSLAYFEVQGKEEQLENIRNYLQGSLSEKSVSPLQLEIAMKACKKTALLVEKIAEKTSIESREFETICQEVEHVIVSIGKLEKTKIAEDFFTLKAHYNQFNSCRGQAEILGDWLENGKAHPDQIQEFFKYENFYWDLVREDNLNKVKAKKKEAIVLHYPFLIEQLKEKLSSLLQTAKDPSSILGTLASGYQKYKTAFADRIESFDDLLHMMRKVIEKPHFYEKARQEFDAAIIDEFQDTDAVQLEIVEKLFMKERPLKALYLVGDPKQSIYAFRKADLYSYLRAREHFKPGERAHLGVNYRSEKSLVSALNVLLCGEATKGWMSLPKLQSSLAVAPVAAAPNAEEDSLGNREGEKRRGSLHFPLIELEASSRGLFTSEEVHKKFLAPYLVQEIFRLKKMALFSLSRIALLVKDRYQAYLLKEELDKAGIATVFVRSEGIADSPVFTTVLALLRALHAPHDLYWLKRFLISPIVNLSPEELLTAALPEFMASMQDLKETFQQKGIAACLQKSLALGFRAGTLFERLFKNGDAAFYEDFQQIQELLLGECSRGERSLAQLLLFMEEMKHKDTDVQKQLQRRVSETENAVTMMTMHASKGLEFDVVFAVGLPLRSFNRDPMDFEEKNAEKMRLFYVAMTRAKRRLYVPLILDKRQVPSKPGQASPIELFFARFTSESSLTLESTIANLQRIQTQAAISWEILSESSLASDSLAVQEKIEIPSPRKFTPFWQREEIVSFSSLFKAGKTHTFEKIELAVEQLPLGAETGNLLHSVMEEIFRQALHCPLAEDKIDSLIESAIKGTPFEGHRDQILPMILKSLTLPLHPLQANRAPFCLCDVSPSSLMPEMEFCYSHQTELRKGFIDLFFMHDGLYYLVDWKSNCLSSYTDEKRNEAMEQHGYRLQAALYADALRRYVKLFDIRPFEECFGGAHYLFLRGAKWESFMPDSSMVT